MKQEQGTQTQVASTSVDATAAESRPAVTDASGPHFEMPPGDEQANPADQSQHNAEQVSAWQELEPGRYLPRRTRGSCVGRALG